MKKILLCLPIIALFASGFMGCSQQSQWNHQQRQAIHEAMQEYRQMIYLEDLNDVEYALFADNAIGTLEENYPVYASFIQMPGVNDTIDMVVVTAVVDELNANVHNMRHIYPYSWLISEGILPPGLNHDQQKAFYQCFAAQINAANWTMGQFYSALLSDTADTSMIYQMQNQCANNLFGSEVTQVEVIEEIVN